MEELLAESPDSGLPVESNALGTESQDDVGAEADTEAISTFRLPGHRNTFWRR